MRTKRRDDRLVSGESICRPRHGDMLRMSEVRTLRYQTSERFAIRRQIVSLTSDSERSERSESEAPAERSDFWKRAKRAFCSARETPRKPKPPWGVLCFTSNLSALGSAAPQAERSAVNRSSLPPWDRRPRPVRRGFHLGHLAMTPSGGFVAEPSPGFTPTRLRFPFGVRIGLPLCVTRTLPLPAHPRKPDRWFVFANCDYFSRGQTAPACPPSREDAQTKGGRAKPRGSSTLVSPSRGLLRSDNVTPVRVSAVSHLVPGCPLSPKAEASFDPELSLLS